MQFCSEIPRSPGDRARVEQLYLDWIDRQLPAGVPPSARRAALRRCREQIGPHFWNQLALKFENRPFTPADEEAVRFELFRIACSSAADCISTHEGMAEVDRWRYHPWKEVDGQLCYKENLEYVYDAIYDDRKVWFEMQLQLERTTLPPDWVAKQAWDYEAKLNLRFRTPHWRWDPRTFTFLEISHSKIVDAHGVEQPGPGTVIGLLDRYAR